MANSEHGIKRIECQKKQLPNKKEMRKDNGNCLVKENEMYCITGEFKIINTEEK